MASGPSTGRRMVVRLAWALLLHASAAAVHAAMPDLSRTDSPGVILQSGEGFTAVVPALDPVGDPDTPGYNARAIARWDVVPWQTFDGAFSVGVVAFHIAGIDAVAFSAEDGPWSVIRRPAINPRTGVEEYFVTLRATDFADGPVEVRAIVYPTAGLPRVLSGDAHQNRDAGSYSLVLYANAAGTLTGPILRVTPAEDLAAAIVAAPEGAILELEEGLYPLADIGRPGRIAHRWLTIRAAADVSRDRVVIRPAQRRKLALTATLLRFEGITMDFATIERIVPAPGHAIWWDRCRWHDSNGWAAEYERYSNPVHPQGWGFTTDCRIEDMIYGAAGLELVRGCELYRISGDVFQNSRCVLNSSIDNVDGRILGHHSDIFQYWAPKETRVLENRIVFGVTGTDIYAQQFFMRTSGGALFRDFAFVDISLRSSLDYFHDRPHFKSQLYGRHQHVLFRNVQTDVDLLFREPGDALPGEGYIAEDVVFENCQVRKRTWRNLMNHRPPGVSVRKELLMRD